MVRIRLEGAPHEVAAVADRLHAFFVVVDESANVPNRPPSNGVRRYVTVEAEGAPGMPKRSLQKSLQNGRRQ